MVVLGSASDEEKMRPCFAILKEFGVAFEGRVCSAHRTPERVESLCSSGARVFICAAGMAAHLAGAFAARTIKPVIGVPLSGGTLDGLDALLATAQMPPGIPVATVAIDGAKNAAWLALEILAVDSEELAERLKAARKRQAQAVAEADRALGERLANSGQSG